MAANAFVRARVDERLKVEAAAVLSELGLTVSDLVRITLTRVARDKALPFELKTPNAETRAATERDRAINSQPGLEAETMECPTPGAEPLSTGDRLQLLDLTGSKGDRLGTVTRGAGRALDRRPGGAVEHRFTRGCV